MVSVIFQGGSLNGVAHQLAADEFMIALQRQNGWEVYARVAQLGHLSIFQFTGVNAYQQQAA